MAKRKNSDSDVGGVPELTPDTMQNHDRERIAMRAYELYLTRGASDGKAIEDWLSAEQELATRQRSPRDS